MSRRSVTQADSRSGKVRITIDHREDLTPSEREIIWRWLLTFFPGDEHELMPVEEYYVRVWHGSTWVSLVQIYNHIIKIGRTEDV